MLPTLRGPRNLFGSFFNVLLTGLLTSFRMWRQVSPSFSALHPREWLLPREEHAPQRPSGYSPTCHFCALIAAAVWLPRAEPFAALKDRCLRMLFSARDSSVRPITNQIPLSRATFNRRAFSTFIQTRSRTACWSVQHG